jgi:hypothetical protein
MPGETLWRSPEPSATPSNSIYRPARGANRSAKPGVLEWAAMTVLDNAIDPPRTINSSRDEQGEIVLAEALRDLQSDSFAERAMLLRLGREQDFFMRDASTLRLVRALRAANTDGKEIVETALDTLFEDFRAGEVFEHLEQVMAILYALKAAGVPYASDVISVFAGSQTAEISPVRRFANALLAR